ncbi:MAG: bifunctional sulfate adenylyltransferase/adenylylsulfate kinase [Desulfobacterales bacterium]|jgi:sulfate adenylyltransferase|nr:bifunctional sulfate adenylyltransferase/adenylylsulfate kinase [Desulfobacterales bacterium]
MTDSTYDAHGGPLISLLVTEDRAALLKDVAFNLPDIVLNDRQLCDVELLATGGFSPLKGFMVRSDFESVLDRMRLQNGTLWPVPICLDVSKARAHRLEAGQSVALRDPEGFLLAVMHVEDIWPVDRQKKALHLYETQDISHPGVSYLFSKTGDYFVGGSLEVLSLPLHFDFKQFRLYPSELRGIYAKMGWNRVVGFQTPNPLHRFQFEMTTKAMRHARANLLLMPVVGMTRPGDFDHYTRVRCFQEVARHYPPDSHVMTLLPLAMRLSGPRDAVLDTILAKNYGCTHFIVGHDHASPGMDKNGKRFYETDRARLVAKKFSDEIGVEIVPFEEIVYLPFEDEYRSVDKVPEGSQTISMTGSDIRKRIREGRRIPEWAAFTEVIDELQKAYPPPRQQGFTVFLTGLSGAGKSTIARVLYSRFMEIGDRPVTLLDGDIVRRNLSSELNFSKEHRDINVHRIGFVASEITKNRGIAICAPIAPYECTRREVRRVIEEYGGFIEVHISTPIEECERRDRKGMYAKARAGLIKGFTGVDDPYEAPEKPELRIDTTHRSPVEAAQEILLFLTKKGYI